ncbi:hypothetical protein MHU86_20541 [Fragilaria crotonensis]|nr:hypothetical protein MHU86_20541 [Fragilaria crotonensis]
MNSAFSKKFNKPQNPTPTDLAFVELRCTSTNSNDEIDSSTTSMYMTPVRQCCVRLSPIDLVSSPSSTTSLAADKQVECLVIGGGISGSTLAHNLHRAGVDVILAEARDYLGGNVKSHKTPDGFIWEEGPNSFATQPSIVRIAHELGIDDQLVFADESLPPWVNHNGKLHPLPKGQGGKGAQGQLELVFGPNGVLKFALAGELLSWPGRIRAGIGAFLGHAPPPPKEETIREWVTRILGEEVFLRCIDPFVSGVYAGNPETLSMKAALPKIARIEEISYSLDWNKFGAIFYGGLKRQVELTKERKADPPDEAWVEFEYGNPGSFREGLSTLPNAIAAELKEKVNLEWKVTSIVKSGDGYEATFETPSGIQTVQAKALVSTVPAHSLRRACPRHARIQAHFRKSSFGNQPHRHLPPPVAAVTVAYPKSSFKDVELANGFGNLQNLPALQSQSSIGRCPHTWYPVEFLAFPGRCPSDYNLLLNYIGGSRDVELSKLSHDEIIAQVDKGCRDVLLKPDALAPKVLGLKLWPTAIPQYELGHLELISELEAAEAKLAGLWVCGNYRSGVAFPDCVTFGYDQAKIVKQYLDLTGGASSVTSPEAAAEMSR